MIRAHGSNGFEEFLFLKNRIFKRAKFSVRIRPLFPDQIYVYGLLALQHIEIAGISNRLLDLCELWQEQKRFLSMRLKTFQ